MKRRLLSLSFLAIAAFTLIGCGPKVIVSISESRSTTAFNQEVRIIEMPEKVPQGFQHVGTVRVGESGFTMKCNYDYVIQLMNEECRKMGGTLIRITEHKKPDIWSSCHRITADIYGPE